jgi:hypothetical protein
MTTMFTIRVLAFGCLVQASAECLDGRSILERFVWPTLPRTADTAIDPDVVIRVIQTADGFQLLVDDVVTASARRAKNLVPSLVNSLDEAVIQRLTTLRAVHAGAVLWGGRALLLPGATHAGKSSLVAELLRRGAEYLSDEYALIDVDGRVHPYPRPLLLRDGSPKQSPMLPAECNATVGVGPAPVGWILSLKYDPAGNWNVDAVPQSIALLHLFQNTPHALAESPDMVRAFHRAVEGAACFAGTRSDAVQAADRILELTESRL